MPRFSFERRGSRTDRSSALVAVAEREPEAGAGPVVTILVVPARGIVALDDDGSRGDVNRAVVRRGAVGRGVVRRGVVRRAIIPVAGVIAAAVAEVERE